MLDDIDLLKRAVAHYSPSGLEGEVARFLVGEMAHFCDEAFVDASGSAVGRWGAGPLLVYVLGHIDTFPGELPVYLEGDTLYGRGSVDAKGPLCAAICAVRRLDPDLKTKLTVRLIGATEEEAPSSRGARHAAQTYPRPDFLVIGEPSGWDAVTLGYKGRLVVHISVEQSEGHSAGPGETAAEAVVDAWTRLRDAATRYRVSGSAFESLQIALHHLNTTSDGLTQTAEAVVGYRLPLGLEPEALMADVRHAVGNSARVAFSGAERAYRGPRDTPLVRAFKGAIRRAGGKPRLKLKTGTSDMNVVAPVWDVPMLAYGPGDASLDHTPQEHLSLPDYARAVAVLTTALTGLTGERYSPESS